MTPTSQVILTSTLSILGTLLGAALTFLFNERSKEKDRNQTNQQKELDRAYIERSQHLDLYKVVYPEMVKAATSVMKQAGTLYMDLRAFYVGAQDKQENERLQKALQALYWEAKAAELLLGDEVVKLVGEFRIDCINGFLNEKFLRTPAIAEGDVWAHDASFKQLAEAVKKRVFLKAFSIRVFR